MKKKEEMKNKNNVAVVLGIIAGILIILTGILTALKITPPITAVGLELYLGLWRIFAGTIIVIFSITMRKDRLYGIIPLALGIFEVFVFLFEKDYSILTIAPLIAIVSGIIGLFHKTLK